MEDEDCVRDLLQSVLERAGYRVLAACKPSEAERLLEGQKDRIQLVVTDVVMPEMNGFALAERVLHTHPRVKILYMSGYDEGHRVPMTSPHAGVYLQKPFEPDILLCKVRDVLDATQPCDRDNASICRAAPQSEPAGMAASLARSG